jgi:hypothetical protein
MVFENRALRRMFGTKREGVTESWRKMHIEKLYNFYSLPDMIRIVKLRRL